MQESEPNPKTCYPLSQSHQCVSILQECSTRSKHKPMGSSDQTQASTEAAEPLKQADQVQTGKAVQPTLPTSHPTSVARVNSFEIVTFGIIVIIAASFALTARLNEQPPSSLIPAAMLS